MDVGSYILLSQQSALQRRMNITANNLANMTTTGFRREKPVFQSYLVDSQASESPEKQVAFVLDWRTTHDLAPGGFQATGNPIDMMIEGEGWFSLQTSDGVAYSRAGEARVDADGRIVNLSGLPFLDESGQPVILPPQDAARVQITGDGTVMGTTGEVGRIAITRFDNDGSLIPRGDGLMGGQGGRLLPPEQIRIRSGGVEGSNVQPVVETTAMVEILRSYQSSARMAESMDDLRRQAIDRLGRIS